MAKHLSTYLPTWDTFLKSNWEDWENFPTLMEELDSCPADVFPNMNSLRAIIKLPHPAALTDFSLQQTVSKRPEIIHADWF